MSMSIDLSKGHSTSLNTLSYIPIDDSVFSLGIFILKKKKRLPIVNVRIAKLATDKN